MTKIPTGRSSPTFNINNGEFLAATTANYDECLLKPFLAATINWLPHDNKTDNISNNVEHKRSQ